MSRWLEQIFSVTLFNLRTIPQRMGSALATAVGIAGVVGVLVAVLAIAEGIRKTMSVSGLPNVAVIVRSGADTEMTSSLSREEVRLIAEAPGVERGEGGTLESAELFVIIDLPKRSTGTSANVPLRGVAAQAFAVRGNLRIVQGRMLEPGRSEVVVGTGAAREFAGLDVGHDLRVGQNTWKIVGLFEAGGGMAESEVWADAPVLASAYHRGEFFQSVYARLSSAAAFRQMKDALTSNPQLQVKVSRLADFYADQSSAVTEFITFVGKAVGSMMALGALFGALNTMYGAVASRTREIATLRALGFGRTPIIVSVLVESLVLALLGGSVGALIAYFVFDGYTAATMNFQTFSQITFAFAVTPALLVQALLWAIALGLAGGLFPAIHAARRPIAAALRET